MPNYNAEISGFAVGDDLVVRRTVNRSASNLPTGVVIAKAWLTIKEALTDADVAAIVSKEITTIEDAGNNGHIEEDGSAQAGDADPILRFDLQAADTRAIDANHRYFDVQVKTDTGAVYTGEKGVIYGEADVTIATT
jgi:hypothetical protein